jgi:acyl-coenzyme A thioesterase PaaI-like protein
MTFHQDAEVGDKELVESISSEAGELINLLRCSHAPDDVLAEATEHIRAAMASLAPYLRQGEGWSTISIASDTPGVGWMDDDLTRCMPYSPVSGTRNPVAPPIKMWRDGNEVRGEAVFSPTYAGPPDCVHGGIIAAVFDEMLSMANVVSGSAGFTGTLTIKYHKHTPLDCPVELWAVTDKNTGRKQFSRGEMRVNGEVTASAEGLFIRPASQMDA